MSIQDIYTMWCSFSLQLIAMMAGWGECVSRTIPLRNAGNIPMEVSMEMPDGGIHFTVAPMQLMMEPGGLSQIIVKFHPKPGENVAAVREGKVER